MGENTGKIVGGAVGAGGGLVVGGPAGAALGAAAGGAAGAAYDHLHSSKDREGEVSSNDAEDEEA